MPLTYFKCVDTLLTYLLQQKHTRRTVPLVCKVVIIKIRDFVEFVILHNFYIAVFNWFLIA